MAAGYIEQRVDRLEVAMGSTVRREAHNDLEERAAALEGKVDGVSKNLGWAESNIYKLMDRVAALEAKLSASPLVVVSENPPELWQVGQVITYKRNTKTPPPLKFGQRVRHLRDDFEGIYIPRPKGYAARSKGGHEFTYIITDKGVIYGAYPWNVVAAP